MPSGRGRGAAPGRGGRCGIPSGLGRGAAGRIGARMSCRGFCGAPSRGAALAAAPSPSGLPPSEPWASPWDATAVLRERTMRLGRAAFEESSFSAEALAPSALPLTSSRPPLSSLPVIGTPEIKNGRARALCSASRKKISGLVRRRSRRSRQPHRAAMPQLARWRVRAG